MNSFEILLVNSLEIQFSKPSSVCPVSGQGFNFQFLPIPGAFVSLLMTLVSFLVCLVPFDGKCCCCFAIKHMVLLLESFSNLFSKSFVTANKQAVK